MANKKINVEKLIADLNPPRWKLWITPKIRREAAKSLGRMKKAEAVEPLVGMLSDPVVRDAAVEALSDMTIPKKHAATALKAAMAYRQELSKRYVDEFFNEDRNSSTMKMIGDMPVPTMRSEPEAFLGAALNIFTQLNPERAPDVEAAGRRGLAPYSRKKFRDNIHLLAEYNIFPTWPELDMLDGYFSMADKIIVQIAGEGALSGGSGPAKGEEVQASGAASKPLGQPASREMIEDYVKRALDVKSALTVPMVQIPMVMEAVFQEIKNRYPLLDAPEIHKLLSGAMFLNCHHCGPLASEYTQGLLDVVLDAVDNKQRVTEELFKGRSAGAFAKGHNPGCTGAGVELTFDPGGIEVPAKAIEAKREALEKIGRDAREQAAQKPAAPAETESQAPVQAAPPALFNVLYKGDIGEGRNVEDVKKGLAALYKVDLARVEGFFSGQVKVLKKNVDLETARKMAAAFEKVGAKAIIQEAQGGE